MAATRQICLSINGTSRGWGAFLLLQIAEGPWVDEKARMIRFKVRNQAVLIRFQVSVDRLTNRPNIDVAEQGYRLFVQRKDDILRRCGAIINDSRFHLSNERWFEVT